VSSDEERRGPGRPPGPLSDRELAQRRAAARTHGLYANSGVPGVPACKSGSCPEGVAYPCDLKRKIDRGGGSLSQCLVQQGHGDVIDRFRTALRNGSIEPLQDMTAALLAGQHVVADENLRLLGEEGLSIEQDLFDAEGQRVGVRLIENPRGALTLKLLSNLGATASDQALTPKAGAERERDQGIGRAAEMAAFIRQRRSGNLGSGDGDADA
jgi:hypothetical protein